MKTYNDLLKCGADEKARKTFILGCITEHKSSENYKIAQHAENYIRQKNSTIMEYRKFIYTITGKEVPDPYATNRKSTSNFYKRFVTQELEYVLANPITFTTEGQIDKYGKKFIRNLKKNARNALNGGVVYGFWNKDHIEYFTTLEFYPLFDEEDGSIKAGVRHWQLDKSKPLRITLYELDGYTDYAQNDKGELEELRPKRAYKIYTTTSEIEGTQIYKEENYPTFPIVPFYGNYEHQSELVGLRTEIDLYDFIKSGLGEDLEKNELYWVIQNAGGMNEEDVADFLNQLERLRAALLDEDGATAEPHTIEPPYQARETYLTRLENDMYYDAMAMNAKDITAGNVTATAIRAAYDNLDQKANELKECIIDFLENISEVAGIEFEEPIFTFNRISNDTEHNTNVLAAAQYLDDETILRKLTFIDETEIPDILARRAEEQVSRYEPLGVEEEDEEEAKPNRSEEEM